MFTELFKKKKIKVEKVYFKHNFKRYYIKEMGDGTCEFWCYLTIQPTFVETKKSYYLGKYDGEIVKCDEFYQLPWDVQKGASRLFCIISKYNN